MCLDFALQVGESEKYSIPPPVVAATRSSCVQRGVLVMASLPGVRKHSSGFVPFAALTGVLATAVGCGHPPGEQAKARDLSSVMQAVVEIQSPDGQGTGFLAGDTQTIATNFHVVEGQSSLTVRFANDEVMEVDGFLVASPRFDLALLHLPRAAPVGAPLELSPKEASVGQEVSAVGSPQGLQGTITKGVVSACRSWPNIATALDIKDNSQRRKYAEDSSWIQTTAPISSGNSGGPLVNADGEVTGINTWQLTADAGQNLNFALDVKHLRMFVSALPSMRIRSLATLPAVSGARGALAGRPELLRKLTAACWGVQADIVGRWYANNCIVHLSFWDKKEKADDASQFGRQVVDQLRGCARRSLIDAETIGRMDKSAVLPLLAQYLSGLEDHFLAISKAYTQAANGYVAASESEDSEAIEEWLNALLEPQRKLNDFVNTFGAACRSRLDYDLDGDLGATVAFRPEGCVVMCLRESLVPPAIFSAVFTGSPTSYLLPTYTRHKDTDEAEIILRYILKAWSKDSESYRWAKAMMEERRLAGEARSENEATQ
jgi:S1-C subfamily serine protease